MIKLPSWCCLTIHMRSIQERNPRAQPVPRGQNGWNKSMYLGQLYEINTLEIYMKWEKNSSIELKIFCVFLIYIHRYIKVLSKQHEIIAKWAYFCQRMTCSKINRTIWTLTIGTQLDWKLHTFKIPRNFSYLHKGVSNKTNNESLACPLQNLSSILGTVHWSEVEDSNVFLSRVWKREEL